MRVLLIGDYPPPHGGVAVHVRQLHDAFREAGAAARVLDIGKGGHAAPGVEPVRTMPAFAAALARHAVERWTLHLHTSGNNPKSWLVAAAVGATPAPAKVITVHSGLAPAFLAQSAAHRALAWAALSGFDRVVAVSEAVKVALCELGIAPDRIEVLPAFCASQVRPGSPPARLAEVRARRSPLLVMAHHPSPVYGRALAFEALSSLRERYPGLGLALFGPGAEGALAAARRAGVDGLVESFGELEHGSALALIGCADVFLRPTTADGDSISVREALALGVPCVASDVAARPPGTLTFAAQDPRALAAKIGEALARPRTVSPAPDAAPALLRLYAELEGRRAAAPAQAA